MGVFISVSTDIKCEEGNWETIGCRVLFEATPTETIEPNGEALWSLMGTIPSTTVKSEIEREPIVL